MKTKAIEMAIRWWWLRAVREMKIPLTEGLDLRSNVHGYYEDASDWPRCATYKLLYSDFMGVSERGAYYQADWSEREFRRYFGRYLLVYPGQSVNRKVEQTKFASYTMQTVRTRRNFVRVPHPKVAMARYFDVVHFTEAPLPPPTHDTAAKRRAILNDPYLEHLCFQPIRLTAPAHRDLVNL
jgi:hypothetical protein